MAGELSQRIHSNFSTDVATWSGFRDEITGAYINDQVFFHIRKSKNLFDLFL